MGNQTICLVESYSEKSYTSRLTSCLHEAILKRRLRQYELQKLLNQMISFVLLRVEHYHDNNRPNITEYNIAIKNMRKISTTE